MKPLSKAVIISTLFFSSMAPAFGGDGIWFVRSGEAQLNNGQAYKATVISVSDDATYVESNYTAPLIGGSHTGNKLSGILLATAKRFGFAAPFATGQALGVVHDATTGSSTSTRKGEALTLLLGDDATVVQVFQRIGTLQPGQRVILSIGQDHAATVTAEPSN